MYLISSAEDNVAVSVGEVVSVGVPRFEPLRGGQVGGVNVTDLGVSFGGNAGQKQFVIPDNSGAVLRTDKGDSLTADGSALVAELKRMKAQCEQAVAEGEKAGRRSAVLKDLLAVYDVEFKEKQDNERRLSNMEASIARLSDLLADFVGRGNGNGSAQSAGARRSGVGSGSSSTIKTE